MKYFLTKYAISNGVIQTIEGNLSIHSQGYVSSRRNGFSEQYKLGRDIFETETAAIDHVKKVMIPKRLKSLKTQIAKTEKLEISVK